MLSNNSVLFNNSVLLVLKFSVHAMGGGLKKQKSDFLLDNKSIKIIKKERNLKRYI